MSRDIERLLERAAGAPAHLDDTGRLWQKGRRRRLRDVAALASASTLIVAGLAVYGIPLPERDGPPAGGDQGTKDVCAADEFGCVRVEAGKPITIGTLLTLSGENADLGLDQQRGAILAAEARGNEVAGHPIEWTHSDERCTPEGGSDSSQSLALDPRVVAVIGTTCSGAAEAAGPVLSELGIVLVSPSNVAPQLTSPATHQPFYLRTSYNDLVQGAAMAEFALDKLDLASAATIHDGSPSGEMLADEFERAFQEAGGQITANKQIEVGQEDFQSELEAIAATDPDMIFLGVFHEGAQIARQTRAMPELREVVLASGDGMAAEDVLVETGAAAGGIYVTRPDDDFGEVYRENVLKPYLQRWGAPPFMWHAYAYDATNLVLDAIETVAFREGGSTNIPRTALKDELFATSGYAGVVGELTCNEFGDCNPTPRFRVVRVTGDGVFETVWSGRGG
jgi:branched-chain amino acid transport system substrate-binding protein